MAKKISSPAKALYIIFALALTFSMVPALAVTLSSSAGANMVNGATAYGSDFILDEAGNGMARWVWDNIVEPGPPNDYHSSNHSAYLKALSQGDSAMVIVTWGCTIGELTGAELSFWHREISEAPAPIMALAIDCNHDGAPDEYAWLSSRPASSPTWLKWSHTPGADMWDTMTHGTGLIWSALVSALGPDCKVLAVMVGYDCYRNLAPECYSGEAFVDDIVVNGRTWDLEPIDKDCVKSELGAAKSGNPIQIEVNDPSADIQDWSYDEQSSTNPDGSASIFDVAHAPKSVQKVTEAYDLVNQLTVNAVAQVDGSGTVTIDETPPAEYGLLACTHAEDNITLDSQPTTPTQLTVTTLNWEDDGDPQTVDCVETAPGANDFLYVHITGTTGAGGTGTAINELLFFSSSSQKTTTQAFGTVNAAGVDAVYSANSAATAIKISAVNHVWFTYEWHQHDTVTVYAQLEGNGGTVAVELIEVDEITLEPDKDSGFFKGILYPTTDPTEDPSPPPTGYERHNLNAPHCSTIELKYPENDPQYAFAWFGVDNDPPVMSNMSPDPSTNESLPTISVDISDTKCDVTKDKISLYVSSKDDNPPFDPEDKVAPANFDFADGTLTYTPSSPLVDGTYYVRVKAADCCWNWAEIDWSFEVESSPPMMIDAITGWTWTWGPRPQPRQTHTRTSIMVIFSERLDPMTVQKTDFTVDYATPIAVEYHDYYYANPNGHDYGLVFLTLATPLATDATPMVVQVGVVEDLAGNPCDKYYEWTCPLDPPTLNDLNDPPPQTVRAQDGIAPVITVTASPEDPGYNETVTVTATSSEPLSAAYLFLPTQAGMDRFGPPYDWDWDHLKPIGWPPYWHEDPVWLLYPGHDNGGWLVMTEGATPYVWTVTFTNTFGPDDDWFGEVAAHDFTNWWQDMGDDGYWEDYECVSHPKWWKHEKWTEESLLFWSQDAFPVWLCEGWNLISVPWDLVDPSVQGFFGGRYGSGITKVYYYTGGLYGYWQYAFLNPTSGYWSGSITTIVPGKAYWVWVSPPELKLLMTVVEPDPLTPPPTYSVVKGWNMIGYTVLLDESPQTSPPQYIKHYLIGLRHLGSTHLYYYDPCDQYDDGPGWVRIHSGGQEYHWSWYEEDMIFGMGYWFWAHDAASFGP